MRTRLTIAVLALAAFSLSLSASADPAADRRAALRQAQEPMRDRQWAQAAQTLADFRVQWANTEEAAEAWALEARALLLAGKAREALDATSAFLAAHGQDAWAGRVRHTAAEAHAALGDPAKTSELLHALAEDAAAPAARARIAALHLKLADDDFDGVETKDDLGRSVKQRDVARALASYQHALAVGLLPADEPRARERVAGCFEELGNPAAALEAYALLVKERDTAAAPAAPESAERWRVGQARAALRAGRLDEARALLIDARQKYPRGKLGLEVLHLMGQERLTPRDGRVDDLAFEEGVALLRQAVQEHRDHPDAPAAQRRLAEAYEQRGLSEKAAQEWSALVDRAPQHAGAPEARHRAALALAQAGRFDDAISEWNRFLSAYANHPLWPEVRERIAAAAFDKAGALKARGDVAGAVAAWKAFAEQRPDDPRAPTGLAEAARALRETKDAEGALGLLRAIAGRYATTPHAAAARLEVGLILEDDFKRLDEAVAAYEEVGAKHAGTPQAQQAAERLQRLKSKHLELRMERVQGTAEPATLRVVTRNIEGLRVRVYRLGLEEYFTRKGTLEGVEALQLEVVKPDLTTEWKFEGYRPFVLTEADRPLPVKGAGAYVVVAGDDDLTGTVMHMAGDVECVVKRGNRGDVLVWAFVRGTTAPVVGARVLMPTDGGVVREVGKTGADGVWRGAPSSAGDKVLVLSEQGAASSELPAGKSVPVVFTDRAYVAADRPVYRPGQEVGWRATLLDASSGGYSVQAGVKARMELIDARGQTLAEQGTVSGPLGTFAGAFALDGECALGAWRLRLVLERTGAAYEGAFQVQEYRKPEFTVEVEPRKPAVLTGEPVEATVQLEYAFGGPVTGAEVEWTARRQPRTFAAPDPHDVSWYVRSRDDAQDRRGNDPSAAALVARGRGTTDADGRLLVKVETATKDDDAELVITAQAEDVTRRWVQGTGRVAVTRRDHMASVRVERQVVQPKQPFTVEVRTMDALGNPVPRSGTLLLQRVRRVVRPLPAPDHKRRPQPPAGGGDGRVPVALDEEEVETASFPLTTDAQGRAEIRVDAPEPGRWRLRWRAQDARGGGVTATADLEAAGEAQDLSKDARLVAARTLHVEGEEAEVLLSSPVGQGLVLVTFEAESVLEHRFVSLAGTSTLLRLPVKGEHAPNVVVAAAVPGKERLLTATCELVVVRRLQLEVRFGQATAKPGDTVDVEVTTRDASGKPVAAEVGLSVLDAALYEIAPDATPPILSYFYGQRRGHGVSTAASLGWGAYGTTRATSADLLAEDAARQGGAEEEMARSALKLAREAMRRGDMGQAVAQALEAQNRDPGSWDARALLVELKANPEAEKTLRRLEAAHGALAAADRMAAGLPAPTPTPEPAEMADAPKRDASFEGSESNELLGVGGGGGGAFKGRGGSKDRKAGGGGAARSYAASLGREFGGVDKHLLPTLELAAAELAAWLGAEAAEEPTLRSDLRDSALWQPRLQTDAEGRASIRLKVPDNLTTWRAVGHGVSGTALVGEGRASLVVRKDLLVRVDAPRFLVAGDAATLPTAVHNGADIAKQVRVTMQSEGLDLGGEDSSVQVPAYGHTVVDRSLTAPRQGAGRVEVSAVADGAGDRTEARLPLLARGVKHVDGRSGLIRTGSADVTETFLEVPSDVIPGSTRLVLALQPSIEPAILEALLALDLFPYGCVEQTVHRFLPAIEALAALKATGSPAAAALARLEDSVRRGAARLKSLQNPDGTFAWFRGQGTLIMTAYGLLGLTGARDLGVADLADPIQRAAQATRRLLPQGDEDARAFAHWALARAKALDGDAYATTFRRRNDDLSVMGLSYLTLAAVTAGRSFDVEQLATLIAARRVEDGTQSFWKAKSGDCFLGSDREATGLAVRALIEAGMATPHAERGMAWLLAHRPLGLPGTTKEMAALVGAAAAYVRTQRVQGFGGSVSVHVDGRQVHTFRTGPEVPTPSALRVALQVGDELTPGRHRVEFKLAGEGRLAWALRLECARAVEGLPGEEHGLLVERRYLAPDKELLEGETPAAKPGYEILRPAARPKWEPKAVEQAESGAPVLVRVTLSAPRDLEYVVVEDALPAGFEVVTASQRGPFDWQERRDSRQVFFLSKVGKGTTTLEYVLQATHLGRFTAFGTSALALYAPEIHGRAAGAVLTVVPRAPATGGGETTPTPDELFAKAKDLLAKKQLDDGKRILLALKDGQPLRDEVLEEIEALLLDAAIQQDDAPGIVRAREELLKRNAARIPSGLDPARAIAKAYRTVGQHEVAGTLLRDLVARGLTLQADWAQTLAGRGREVEGLDALTRALKGQPTSNAAASLSFKSAQRWRELRRPEGRGERPAGKPMDAEMLDALYALTAHFAAQPVADPAGYALVEALRRSKDTGAAGAAGEAFLRRFPDSVFADDTRFFLAETRYRAFEEAPSEASAKAVREAADPLTKPGRFLRPDGSAQTESDFRERAHHLLGRVAHVLGHLDVAERHYRVASSIEDAREALAWLTARALATDESVVRVGPGAAAIPLRYRNVEKATLRAYPVDLQVLFAVRKTLVGLNKIDLSGITAQRQWDVDLPEVRGRLEGKVDVDLGVALDAFGAWLVIAKAGDLEAATLVVKTGLTAELQRVGGKVRVHVRDASGAPVRGAYVAVSNGQAIRARGLTDGRGVLEAPEVGPTAFAVASKGDQVALAR